MRLTRACLSIGKDCTIVAFEDVGHDRSTRVIVNLFLCGIISISEIKCELLGLLWIARAADNDLPT